MVRFIKTFLFGLGALLKGAACALALLAAFPNSLVDSSLWWGAYLGLAGVILLIRRQEYVAAGAAGGFFYAGLFYWVAYSMEGILPWIALVLLQLFYWVAWIYVCAQGQQYRGITWALWVGGAFSAWELLRASTPWGGNPWGILAFTQVDGPFKHWIALLAQSGTSFLIGVLAAALAENLWQRCSPCRYLEKAPEYRRLNQLALGILLLTLAGYFGLGKIILPADSQSGQADLLVVQGNVAQPVRETLAERTRILRNHLQETALALAKSDKLPEVVIWGEQAADVYPEADEEVKQEIQSFFRSYGLALWFGSVREVGSYRYNEYLYWDKNGELQDKYLKQEPVPFGEFLPWRSVFEYLYPPVKELLPTDVQAGTETGVFRQGDLKAGINICFEIAVESVVEANISQGANLLLVPTNNMSFGQSPQSRQQLQILRFRAREFGRSAVQTSLNGVSGVSDHRGNLLAQTELFTSAHIRAQVDLYSQRTPASYLASYWRWGVLVFGGGQLLVIAANKILRQRKQS